MRPPQDPPDDVRAAGTPVLGVAGQVRELTPGKNRLDGLRCQEGPEQAHERPDERRSGVPAGDRQQRSADPSRSPPQRERPLGLGPLRRPRPEFDGEHDPEHRHHPPEFGAARQHRRHQHPERHPACAEPVVDGTQQGGQCQGLGVEAGKVGVVQGGVAGVGEGHRRCGGHLQIGAAAGDAPQRHNPESQGGGLDHQDRGRDRQPAHDQPQRVDDERAVPGQVVAADERRMRPEPLAHLPDALVEQRQIGSRLQGIGARQRQTCQGGAQGERHDPRQDVVDGGGLEAGLPAQRRPFEPRPPTELCRMRRDGATGAGRSSAHQT